VKSLTLVSVRATSCSFKTALLKKGDSAASVLRATPEWKMSRTKLLKMSLALALLLPVSEFEAALAIRRRYLLDRVKLTDTRNTRSMYSAVTVLVGLIVGPAVGPTVGTLVGMAVGVADGVEVAADTDELSVPKVVLVPSMLS
jgi:hypothetical protein